MIFTLIVTIQSCGNPESKRSNSHPVETEILPEAHYQLVFDKVKTLPNQAELAIAIIENGKVNFVGVKREQDSTVFLHNKDKVFEIGSITKVFTGTLLATYVEEGSLERSASIQDYLDFSLKDSVEISFEQLATHTSGLPRVPPELEKVSLENPYKNFGEAQLKNYLSNSLKLNQAPGLKCDYSNLGGGLLGHVLSLARGMSYEELLQKDLFTKYGMTSSTSKRSRVGKMLVKGLNDKGEEVSNWDMSVLVGAGGILSSVSDLAVFALAQFDEANLSLKRSRTELFKVTEDFAMGYGWSIVKMPSGEKWNWHNGGTGGYTSSMILDVGQKKGVIILSNITALGKLTQKINELGPELMDVMAGDSGKENAGI